MNLMSHMCYSFEQAPLSIIRQSEESVPLLPHRISLFPFGIPQNEFRKTQYSNAFQETTSKACVTPFEENDAWSLMGFVDSMEERCGISATRSC